MSSKILIMYHSKSLHSINKFMAHFHPSAWGRIFTFIGSHNHDGHRWWWWCGAKKVNSRFSTPIAGGSRGPTAFIHTLGKTWESKICLPCVIGFLHLPVGQQNIISLSFHRHRHITSWRMGQKRLSIYRQAINGRYTNEHRQPSGSSLKSHLVLCCAGSPLCSTRMERNQSDTAFIIYICIISIHV